MSKTLLVAAVLLGFGTCRSTAQPSGILAAASCLRPLVRLAPTPNYISRIKHAFAWKSFPLKVFFLRDRQYASAREAMARRGLSRWVIASEGLLDFVVTEDAGAADILVRFDSKTGNGLTQSGRDKAGRHRAIITIGVKPSAESDIEAIAAHEYGHVLGIDGHSDSKRDLMYPYHYEGTHGRPSVRDLNTMAGLYPKLRRRLPQPPPSQGGVYPSR